MQIIIKLILIFTMLFTINSCGNNGASNPTNLSNGNLTAYEIKGGKYTESSIGIAALDSSGNYVLKVGNFIGPLLVWKNAENILNTATMTTSTYNTPLWTAVANGYSGLNVSISPFSDVVVIIAAEQPGGLTSTNIIAAINLFKSKLGFDPTIPTIVDSSKSLTQSEKYDLTARQVYLGGFFQYLADNPGKNLLDASSDFASALNRNSNLLDVPEIRKSIDNYLICSCNTSGINLETDLADLANKMGVVFNIPNKMPVLLKNAYSVIQLENAKTSAQGVTTSWRLSNAAVNGEIEGYASATSINRGESLDFFVNTIDPTFKLTVYRMGWYNGAGARQITNPVTLIGRTQPTCPIDTHTGMVECQWTSSYTLNVPDNLTDPTDWASGFYVAKLIGSSGKDKYIMFVVRNDNYASDVLFQASVTTYQAYNNWGGKSLYPSNSTGPSSMNVSFNRPYAGWSGVDPFLLGWDVEMVRFLEKEGFDVTYSTNIDTHLNGYALLNHKAFLSVGHDEYWTREMRNNIETARDAGVNLGFFGANTGYWQIRLEPDSNSQPNRTVVAYKGNPHIDPIYAIHPNLTTTTFRSSEINRPEASLVGVMYDDFGINGDLIVKDCSNFICSGTGLSTGNALPHLLGNEVDILDKSSPENIQVILSSPYDACINRPACTIVEKRFSSATYYQAKSGSEIFASGSMQWNWGLSLLDRNTIYTNPSVQQMTRNIINRFIGK